LGCFKIPNSKDLAGKEASSGVLSSTESLKQLPILNLTVTFWETIKFSRMVTGVDKREEVYEISGTRLKRKSWNR
jgi:hypothetical protein